MSYWMYAHINELMDRSVLGMGRQRSIITKQDPALVGKWKEEELLSAG